MNLEFEHFENDLPFNRMPLSEHLELLSSQLLLQQQQQQQAAECGAGKEAEGKAAKDPAKAATRPPVAAPGGPWPSLEPSPASRAFDASLSDDDDDSLADELIGPAVGAVYRSGSGSGRRSDQSVLSVADRSTSPKRKLQGSFLKDALVSELHPASWFAVAWYPVYRIPDAPLCARFLTFHSFAPLQAAMRSQAEPQQQSHSSQQRQPESIPSGGEDGSTTAVQEQQTNQEDGDGRHEDGDGRHAAAVGAAGKVKLQVVGLKWYNMHGERWLEPISNEEALRQQRQQYTLPGGGGSDGGVPGGRRTPRPAIDHAWQAHLGELQLTAERLARGHGLRVLGPAGPEESKSRRHSDFEFFNSRS